MGYTGGRATQLTREIAMRSVEELKISKGRQPSASSEDIEAIEKLTGFTLPYSYTAFLKCSNGGHPELDTFSSPVGEWSVNNFFYVGDELNSTESVTWNYLHRWQGAARSLLPIAKDGGGNLFCLDLAYGEDAPVIIWIHDSPAGLQRLANSFEEFVDGLKENPDYI